MSNDALQCVGYKAGGPCTAMPRFKVTSADDPRFLYCCGWHLASTVLREYDVITVSVKVLW